jgi:hypothetical protein
MFLVVGLKPPASDETSNSVKQLHPILQGRFGHGLPLIETLFTREEAPLATHALGIHLELYTLLGDAFPTDFSFGHGF